MRLTVTTFTTLDGVMQGPGGPDEDRNDGFDLGGWQVPYIDEEMGPLVTRWFEAADGFLLGRKTYEIFAGHWSRVTDPDDPVATRLNRLPKYVVSTTLDEVTWNNSTLIKGDVAEEIARLKRAPGNGLQVHGSGVLIQTLIEHGLIDEYRLWIYPVLLGRGQRVFADGVAPTALELVDIKTLSRGGVIHVYRPAGKPQFGSVLLEGDGAEVRDSLSKKSGL